MQEPYHDENEDYDDDQYDNDYPLNSPYQWYYKFDVGQNSPVSNWLNDMLKQWINSDSFNNLSGGWEFFSIPGFQSKEFPVNSWYPNTVKHNSFQYFGSNYHGSPIWKKQYFAIDKIYNEYKLHLQAHAKHFVQQPQYYNGLFDILN